MPTDHPKTSLDELDKVETHLNQGTAVSTWLRIRAYEPERGEAGEVVWHVGRNVNPRLANILTIGVYEGLAFLIKHITKLAKTYECTHCRARFTKVCNLQRHFQSCSAGKTVIYCPGGKVEDPQTAFEKVFYPNSTASRQALLWLEREAKQRKIHIHHARCGHGGGGREMASARKRNEEDGVPIPRLPLPRMPKMLPTLSRRNDYQQR